MKSIFLMSLLVVAACGVKKSSPNYGKTTVSDLVAEKGQPIEEKKIPVTEGKILLYEGNEKYQVKGDVVTHGFKDPKGDEKTLIFWKHKFKDCDTTIRKINETKGHELPEYELACPSEGVSVVYTEGSEFISRVVEYEKK